MYYIVGLGNPGEEYSETSRPVDLGALMRYAIVIERARSNCSMKEGMYQALRSRGSMGASVC